MARLQYLLFLFVVFVGLASAAAPTFCKCTCFKNSTIIPLGPEHQDDDTHSFLRRDLPPLQQLSPHLPVDHSLQARSASTSCSACTKAFCLTQGISFCKEAEEDDVFTMCFQRDSNKDRIIVWAFIVGTLGLLGWAMFRRVVEWRRERADRLGNPEYAPMAGGLRP